MSNASKLYLGIDPGVSGAWAVLTEEGTILMAGLWDDVDVLLHEIKNNMLLHCTCLEKCHAMPKQGVVSTATFVENIGMWKGMLKVLDLSYIETVPDKWQKAILDYIPTKEPKAANETEKERKARLARNRKQLKDAVVDFVKRRFPDSKAYIILQKHQGIADAICMAEYARRTC